MGSLIKSLVRRLHQSIYAPPWGHEHSDSDVEFEIQGVDARIVT